jgi:hypothetical protein
MADNLPSGTEFRAGRSDSTASASSTGSATGGWAGLKQQAAAATTTPTQQSRASQAGSPTFRRPSYPLFEGLTAQKRKDDAESVARRQSMSEQRPATGFIGQMWNKYVYLFFFFCPITRLILG